MEGLAMTEVQGLLEGGAALLWPLITIVILYLYLPAIKAIIKSLKSRKFSVKVFGQELTMDQAFGEVESRVRALQMLIKGSITDYEYDKLKGLASDSQFPVRFHWDMYHELRRLDALRYIQPRQGYGIESIKERNGSGDEFDLKQYIYITNEGREYLKLREELLSA
jgi:isocitrate/isopropylmalate dehydrogenase